MIAKALAIMAFAALGKLIEECRRLFIGKSGFRLNTASTRFFYTCLNVHLCLSLGMLGLAWGSKLEETWFLLLMIGAGVVSKGVFSAHRPDSLSLRDRDMLLGLYLPNGFALASVIFTAIKFW